MPDRDPRLELADWRRRTGDIFRAGSLAAWRAGREQMFREHSQSPIPESARQSWGGLHWWPEDARWRVPARFIAGTGPGLRLEAGGRIDEFRKIGRLEFRLEGVPCRLDVHWLEGYAGGLFIPFRDQTSGDESYGGGRYLTDTAKGSDGGGLRLSPELVVDFNWAYHPSCFYDPAWVCPLAAGERLPVSIRAGERSRP